LVVFEGAFRKWVVPDSPSLRYLAYFAKEFVILFAGFAGLGVLSPRYKTIVGKLLVISVLLLAIPTLFNLSSISAIGAVLSLRTFVLFPACAFFAAGLIRSLRDIDRMLLVFGVVTILLAGLGYVQFNLPADHVLNRYDMDIGHIATAAGHVRVTGTFSYITGMSLFCGLGCWVGLYFFLSSKEPTRTAWGVVVTSAALCCGLMTVSRGAMVFGLGTVVGSVALFRRAKPLAYFAFVAMAVALLLGTSDFEKGSQDGLWRPLVRRMKATQEREQQRYGALGRLDYILQNVQGGLGLPLGKGLGITQRGSSYFAKTGAWGGGYEHEIGRILYEVGWPGLLAVMIWRVAVLYLIWSRLRSARDDRLRALLAVSLPLLALFSLEFNAFNHVGAAFFWLVATVALGAVSWQTPGTRGDSARFATRQKRLARWPRSRPLLPPGTANACLPSGSHPAANGIGVPFRQPPQQHPAGDC
jgi:hypothetical protein